MTTDPTRRLLEELSRSTWALSALSVAAHRGVLARLADGPASVAELADGARLEPAAIGAIVDVLVALGLAARADDRITGGDGLRARVVETGPELLADDLAVTIAAALAPAQAARDPAARVVGWAAEDGPLVRAQGRLSAAMSKTLAPVLRTPAMYGLGERLGRPGAVLLDVGAGAAGLSIAFARMFPELRVVGVEPAPVAFAEARAAVAAAGLDDRVTLRQQLGQEVADEGVYTAVYVAQMFMPDDAIAGVWQAALRALVAGGVLFTGAVAHAGDDLVAAVSRWRNAAWGGGVRTADVLVDQLERAGFVAVQALAPAPGSSLCPVFARRDG
jgi:hypothetical protein